QKFSLSDRSAQRYMGAYCFAVKNDTVADLNMSPSALYLLAEEDFESKVVAACVKLSRTKRLGRNDVWECYRVHRNENEIAKAQPKDWKTQEKSAAEKKEAHERWVREGKPALEAEQEEERRRADQHLAKIALARLKEECERWLPRMNPEERKEAL